VRAQSTDAELVAAAAEGERLALAALYDRYAPLLLALANRLLRHQREAEDLLHDVFLEVWRQAGDYDPSRGSVRAWLVMRLRSRALDRLKSVRHTRVVSLESTTLPEEPQAPPVEQTFGHDQAMVRDALLELPADQRVVLELAYFEGLSLSEIATRLEVPIGTIKSRLARALTRLRDTLRALSDEDDT
jgi:RNA polymerase sigma-70 factor (ECF subfamily)